MRKNLIIRKKSLTHKSPMLKNQTPALIQMSKRASQEYVTLKAPALITLGQKILQPIKV